MITMKKNEKTSLIATVIVTGLALAIAGIILGLMSQGKSDSSAQTPHQVSTFGRVTAPLTTPHAADPDARVALTRVGSNCLAGEDDYSSWDCTLDKLTFTLTPNTARVHQMAAKGCRDGYVDESMPMIETDSWLITATENREDLFPIQEILRNQSIAAPISTYCGGEA